MTDGEGSQSKIWLKTEPDVEGVYHVVLELGEDDIVPLDADAAYGWAREVLSAVAQAEYDAAVLAQITSFELDDSHAAAIVTLLRTRRAGSVPVGAVPGLALVPGVSAFTRKGFLSLERHGEGVGQWELEDARQHALGVIEAFEVAQLDTTYLATLREFGLEEERAMSAVHNLLQHR